jgi:lipocalin
VTADYSLRDDGGSSHQPRLFRSEDAWQEAEGKAYLLKHRIMDF